MPRDQSKKISADFAPETSCKIIVKKITKDSFVIKITKYDINKSTT